MTNAATVVGTTQGSLLAHVAVETVGGLRPACRARDVRAVLRVSRGLGLTDVTCKRCVRRGRNA